MDCKTRLLAELAREAQARGALVQDHITEERPGVPMVVLLDDIHRKSAADLNALTELVLSARPPLLVVGAAVLDQAVERRAAIPKIFPDQLLVPPLVYRMTSLRSSGCMSRRMRSKTASPSPPGPLACRCRCMPSPAATARSRQPHKWRRLPPAFQGLGVTRRSHRSGSRKASETGNAYGWWSAHEPAAPPVVVCPYKGLCSSTLTTPGTSLGRSASLRGSLQVGGRAPRSRRCVGERQVLGGPAGLVAALRAGMLPGSERWGTVLTTPTQPPPDLADASVEQSSWWTSSRSSLRTPSPTQRDEYVDWLVGAAACNDMTVVVVVRSDYYVRRQSPTPSRRSARGQHRSCRRDVSG